MSKEKDKVNAQDVVCALIDNLIVRYPKVWKRMCHCPPGTKGLPLLSSSILAWISKNDIVLKVMKDSEAARSKQVREEALRKLSKEEKRVLGV